MSPKIALCIIGASFAVMLVALIALVQLLLPQLFNFYLLAEKNKELAVGLLLGAAVLYLFKKVAE